MHCLPEHSLDIFIQSDRGPHGSTMMLIHLLSRCALECIREATVVPGLACRRCCVILSSVIETGSQLRELADRVAAAPWVGIDTEADSLHSYPEKLCLLQLAIPGEVQLVDPLADLHLEPLWEALDRHELIFHAADYDLHLLYNGHNFTPSRIFDTMWGARLLGEPKFGLNDVLTRYLGLRLEKGSQKADWGRRPLTPKMIDYALNDVRYLNDLVQLLREKLFALGRLDWHRQVCERLIRECAVPARSDPNTLWRVKGHERLSPTGLAILREIWQWREKDARRTNRPPFFILRHEALSEIAAQASEEGIKAVRMPHFLTARRREGILESIERGLAVPPEKHPRPIVVRSRRLSRQEIAHADELKVRRDRRAADLGIDPTIIASRGTLFALARSGTQEWDQLMPWQRELLAPLPPGTPPVSEDRATDREVKESEAQEPHLESDGPDGDGESLFEDEPAAKS